MDEGTTEYLRFFGQLFGDYGLAVYVDRYQVVFLEFVALYFACVE